MDGLEGGALGSRLGEGDAVPSVGERVSADGSGVGDGIKRIDYQHHRDHRVTAINGLERDALGSRLGESETVPGVGEFVSADSGGVGDGIERFHKQGHRYCRVAAVNGGSGGALGSRLGKGDTVPCVGELVLANSGSVGDGVDRFHHQCHGDYGVAAIDGLKGGALGSSTSKGDAVPRVRQLAGTDGLGVGDGIAGFYKQGHRNCGVAAMDGLEGGALGSRLGEGDAVPSVGERVSADGLGVGDGIKRIDYQHHRDHGVAAINGLEGGVLGSRLYEDNVVPSVGKLVSTNDIGVGDIISRVDVHGHHHDAVHPVGGCEHRGEPYAKNIQALKGVEHLCTENRVIPYQWQRIETHGGVVLCRDVVEDCKVNKYRTVTAELVGECDFISAWILKNSIVDAKRQIVFQDSVVNMDGIVVQHPHQDRKAIDKRVIGAGVINDTVGPKGDVGKQWQVLLHGVTDSYRVVCAIVVAGTQNVKVDGSCSVWNEIQRDLPVGAGNRVSEDGHSRGRCHRDVNAVGKDGFAQTVHDLHPIPAAFAAVGDKDVNDS